MQDTLTGDIIPIDDTTQEARDRALPRERQGIVIYIGQPIIAGDNHFEIHRISRREVVLRRLDAPTIVWKAGDQFALMGATFNVTSAGNTFLRLAPTPGVDVEGKTDREGDKFIARIDVDGVVHEQLIHATSNRDAFRAALKAAKNLGGKLFEIE